MSDKIIYVDKSYIVATILNVNNKYKRKRYVTFEELNYVTNELQKKFNENNCNAIILNSINSEYFDISEVIQAQRKGIGVAIEDIIFRFKGHLDFNILTLIWDEKNILNYLDKLYKMNVMAVPGPTIIAKENFEATSEEGIEKINSNAKDFVNNNLSKQKVKTRKNK